LNKAEHSGLPTRVFNSWRLGINTPKNFIPYAQILRGGRHDVQIILLYVYLFIINLELTSESVFKCFASSKNFCWLSCFWILHFMKTWHGNHIL